ncbi:MAG: copper homeostasis protein CutC [Bacteroidales bacterium]|nr:copper homeostasis protein CutC [Bacteroidales bacterium]
MDIKFEICCGNLQSALNAQLAGANRVELCSALSLGGLTPSYGFIEQARRRLKIDINVLIRPRQGDFLYESEEVAEMISDIQACARLGVNGVVIGALDPYGNVDMDSCRAMVAVAKHLGLSVTFHRAIDRAANIFAALEDAIALGVDRVLTSGGKPTAMEGLEILAKMNRFASGKTIIMPGAGVNSDNIKEILATTGAREIHFSGSTTYDSPMIYREGVSFTPSNMGGDFTRTESSVDKIRETIGAVK